jgi:hypothetical protein
MFAKAAEKAAKEPPKPKPAPPAPAPAPAAPSKVSAASSSDDESGSDFEDDVLKELEDKEIVSPVRVALVSPLMMMPLPFARLLGFVCSS